MRNAQQTDRATQQRHALYDQAGLKYTATFQPRPQPAERYPQLHWLITLATPKGILQTPYAQGMAHVWGYQDPTLWAPGARDYAARAACETGIVQYKANTKKQPNPKLDDVMCCLISDASVLDYSSFEEWAEYFGYDIDSRKAEEIYRACLRGAQDLRRILGRDVIRQLRELFQDY